MFTIRNKNDLSLPKYEAKVITRGNCMMCGKELTAGLFFCKECENKANFEALEQEPCEDAISRDAALDAFNGANW